MRVIIVMMLVAGLLLAGCVNNSVTAMVHVTEKGQDRGNYYITTGTGELTAVIGKDVYDKLEVNHTYLVEIGGLRSLAGDIGIRSIVGEWRIAE